MIAHHNRGFTLIELMVSLGLFSVVITLAAGAYLLMLDIGNKTRALATGVDDLSFALESMTRDIRTGTSYCGSGLPACSNDTFWFKNSKGDTVSYTLNGTVLEKQVGSVTSILSDPIVEITRLRFYTTGTTPGDARQSRVSIVIAGEVATKGVTQEFNIETAATMRGTDL